MRISCFLPFFGKPKKIPLLLTTTTPGVAADNIIPPKHTIENTHLFFPKRRIARNPPSGRARHRMCVRKTLRHRTLLYNKAGRTKFLSPHLFFFYFPLFNFPCHQRHKTARLNQPPFFSFIPPTDFSPSFPKIIRVAINCVDWSCYWFASALRVCEPLRKLGRGYVFVLFLTHSSHDRFYPNFLQKGFFSF